MTVKKPENKIIETVLDEPVRFKIAVGGLFRLLFIKKLKLSLRDLKLGTLLKISPLLLDINYDGKAFQENAFRTSIQAMNDNIKTVSMIIAIAILNNRTKIKLYGRLLSRIIRWNLTSKELSKLLSVIIDKMDVMTFMSSIVLIRGLQILKKETSPSDSGEIIAPGI